MSVPVFVTVTIIVLFSVVNFRMRPGEEKLDGPPIHGNTRLEVIWTAIPAIMLVALCTYAYVVLTDIEEAQANEMRINVTGQQFAWTLRVPAGRRQADQVDARCTCPRTARCASTSRRSTSSTTSGCRPSA